MLVSRLWEERRLAYPINGHRKGTYWLTYFRLDSEQTGRRRRDSASSATTILRVLFLKVDPRIVDALVAHALADRHGRPSVPPDGREGERRTVPTRTSRTRSDSATAEGPMTRKTTARSPRPSDPRGDRRGRPAHRGVVPMASYNRVILVGNLTRDPELRYIPSGTAVTDIGLAVNDRRKNASGEWVDETTFVDVTLWGRPGRSGQRVPRARARRC